MPRETAPRRTKKKWMYMADYRCGCTYLQDFRKDLLPYCGKHGEDRRQVFRLENDPTMERGIS